MEFLDDYHELSFLQDLVTRLWHASNAGRVTAGDSMDLDFAWDLLEEYNLFYDAREALSAQ